MNETAPRVLLQKDSEPDKQCESSSKRFCHVNLLPLLSEWWLNYTGIAPTPGLRKESLLSAKPRHSQSLSSLIYCCSFVSAVDMPITLHNKRLLPRWPVTFSSPLLPLLLAFRAPVSTCICEDSRAPHAIGNLDPGPLPMCNSKSHGLSFPHTAHP